MMSQPVPETRAAAAKALVEVRGLVKHFDLPRGIRVWRPRSVVHAVNDIDLEVARGEFLAVIGESGSGKTTLGRCLAGLVAPTAGSIRFDGQPYVEVRRTARSRRVIRHRSRAEMATRVQMVFQDPSSALNPRKTVRGALLEPLLVHRLLSRAEARIRVNELLELTGVGGGVGSRFPHELNSGQRQRVVIARALTVGPDILIADEPVSKLDVSMQGQILNLLTQLHRELHLTIVFITHDLSVVRQVAERVVVMYLGRVMEACDSDAFFGSPRHPYSEALVAAAPRFAWQGGEELLLEGEIPSPIDLPPGCPFASRCPLASSECLDAVPPLHASNGHLVACIKR